MSCRLLPRALLYILAALAITLLIGQSFSAAQSARRPAVVNHTFVVNSTLDELDPDPSTGQCISTPSGKCTLRAAIQVANFVAAPNTITLPSGVYMLTRPGYDDGSLVGDLDVGHDLTIQGAGSAATIVDGNGAVTQDRVFQILSSATQITLIGLTIRDGQSLSSTVSTVGGGGLYMEGSGHLQLNDVIIAGNTADFGGGLYANFSSLGGSMGMDHVIVRANIATNGGIGGGVFASLPSRYSRVVIQASQIYSNSADQLGGGLYVSGDANAQWSVEHSAIYSNTAPSAGAISNRVPLAMTDSILHDNQAWYDGGAIEAYSPFVILRTTLAANSAGRYGGAIFDLSDHSYPAYPEFAHIEQSTLSGNSAQYGGGIFHDGYTVPDSLLTLLNSTLSGNVVYRPGGATGSADGGGLYVISGQAQLFNSTVAGNRVQLHFPSTYSGIGGGLYITASSTFTAENSLIANNTHGNGISLGVPDDCFSSGTVGTLAFDLILTATNCYVTGGQVGNIVGQDPRLGPLQNNGGSTLTEAPQAGSPVIDAGAALGCTDQLGAPITIDQRGFRRPIGANCDIGAVEYSPYAIDLPLIDR